jgi:hypothetical protein
MKCYHCAKIDYEPWRLNYLNVPPPASKREETPSPR